MTTHSDRATRLRAMIEKHLGTRLKHDYGENPYVEVRVWEIALIANQLAAAIDAEVREQCAQKVEAFMAFSTEEEVAAIETIAAAIRAGRQEG